MVVLQQLESNREMATGGGERGEEDHGHENACTLKFEPRPPKEDA